MSDNQGTQENVSANHSTNDMAQRETLYAQVDETVHVYTWDYTNSQNSNQVIRCG